MVSMHFPKYSIKHKVRISLAVIGLNNNSLRSAGVHFYIVEGSHITKLMEGARFICCLCIELISVHQNCTFILAQFNYVHIIGKNHIFLRIIGIRIVCIMHGVFFVPVTFAGYSYTLSFI